WGCLARLFRSRGRGLSFSLHEFCLFIGIEPREKVKGFSRMNSRQELEFIREYSFWMYSRKIWGLFKQRPSFVRRQRLEFGHAIVSVLTHQSARRRPQRPNTIWVSSLTSV